MSILNNLYVNKSDIQKVISLLKNSNSLNLMQNQVIKLTLENTNNFKSISNILIPVTKSRKLEIYKDLKKNSFVKKEIITNLEKNSIKRGYN